MQLIRSITLWSNAVLQLTSFICCQLYNWNLVISILNFFFCSQSVFGGSHSPLFSVPKHSPQGDYVHMVILSHSSDIIPIQSISFMSILVVQLLPNPLTLPMSKLRFMLWLCPSGLIHLQVLWYGLVSGTLSILLSCPYPQEFKRHIVLVS